MLYFHAVRGADAGTKINNPRGAVRTRQNIPKPHRVRAVRGAVDISSCNHVGSFYVTCFARVCEIFMAVASELQRGLHVVL